MCSSFLLPETSPQVPCRDSRIRHAVADAGQAFHDAVIAFYKAAHDFVRMQDPSEPVDSGVANSEMTARVKAILKVAETLDGETKSQLVDAGCGLASFF